MTTWKTISITIWIENQLGFATDKDGNVIDTSYSKWEYLLPILFSILGGLIMYFMERKKNPDVAKKGLILGLVLFFIYSAYAFFASLGL